MELTPRDGTEYDPDYNTPTGTATITEYLITGDTMAHLIYAEEAMDGSARSYRLVRDSDEKVYKAGTGMVATTVVNDAAFPDGNIDLTYNNGIPGYAITIPSAVPDGSYWLMIFDAAKAGPVTPANYTGKGWKFKWRHGNMFAARELVADGVL